MNKMMDIENKKAGELSTAELQNLLASRNSKAEQAPFDVLKTLKGKNIFIIGGTGFLGRVTLYYLLRHVPEIKNVTLLIRTTHGQSGYDRFEREILNNPIFTNTAEDREYFAKVGPEKVRVVEGDGSSVDLGMNEEDKKWVLENADAFINTAGNVEFNPPVDASLSANFRSTLNCLNLIEQARHKKYVHISTCYVADRTVHINSIPETHISAEVRTPEGNQILIDPLTEVESLQKDIDVLKARYENDDRLKSFEDDARRELEKMGKDPNSKRMVQKIAKALRTMEMREELIRLGQTRGRRINRPNVYTYTKSLAELLVQQYEKRGVQSVIVRPSVVETALRVPFTGWNEGIQGSVAILYLIYKGQRMIPSLPPEGGRLPSETFLDVIPVDMVAAGMVLSTAALIEDRHKPVYQLAAGPINPRLTITRMVEMAQLLYREEYDSLPPVKRFLRKNWQSFTVNQKTFDKFSSPGMLKRIEKARDRIGKMQTREGSLVGNLVEETRGSLDRFYNLSLMKNKIFEEFQPFINGGYPVFENDVTRQLCRELPLAQRQLFFFDPQALDYHDYYVNVHMPGLQKWVFPVMAKRVEAVMKAGRKKDEERMLFFPRFRDMLSGTDFVSMLNRNLGKIGSINFFNPENDEEYVDKGTKVEPFSWVKPHLAELKGLAHLNQAHLEKDYAYSDEDFERLADHTEMITGVRPDAAALKKCKTAVSVEKEIRRTVTEQRPEPYFGQKFLSEKHREGLIIPHTVARPVRRQLYRLQMWFFRQRMSVQIAGKANIPYNTNHVIVIANHSSHLDYGVVQYSLGDWGEDMGILAARDYFFDTYWMNTFFSNFMTLIPMEREDSGALKALEPAFDFLENGGPLLIFPEGTRSHDGQIQEFKPGLGVLLRRSRADILPIRISGTHDALPKGKSLPRKKDIRVRIGKLVPYEEIEKKIEGLSPTKANLEIASILSEKVINPSGAGNII